ncbi:hypothetical protein JAAARDRAFT_692396 [Jaapia argillacea MUCL 33604]|uniref:Adenylate kinase n=1 Tax=Jaapia argillacea MUCL 33604 TaxID=933084 RepID=A0A067PNZ0_9AGAM|nr:hypothetical protein JAAARDRAFT_692396 [Jaapia argillacea MUCL 33604]
MPPHARNIEARGSFPLRGDGEGRYRIHIVGNSGMTTLGQDLSSILGIPFTSLDALFWQPNWGQTPTEEFRTKVQEAMLAQPDKGWIMDGNYIRRLGGLIDEQATDIIWLDPPLLLYLPRLCYRTFLRLLGRHPPCSPGCSESIREVFFSKESIVWWCISQHWKVRRMESERFATMGLQAGGKMRRIGGWGSELERWLKDVRELSRRE